MGDIVAISSAVAFQRWNVGCAEHLGDGQAAPAAAGGGPVQLARSIGVQNIAIAAVMGQAINGRFFVPPLLCRLQIQTVAGGLIVICDLESKRGDASARAGQVDDRAAVGNLEPDARLITDADVSAFVGCRPVLGNSQPVCAVQIDLAGAWLGIS